MLGNANRLWSHDRRRDRNAIIIIIIIINNKATLTKVTSMKDLGAIFDSSTSTIK